MGKIHVHIANANDKFSSEDVSIFNKAAKVANEFISKNFDFDYDVDLIITAPSFLLNTIPEDGISGRTYNSQLIILVIDEQQKEITEEFVFETICHEMAHSLRWEKLPEYSRTLFDGMVFEGLAIVFEEEAIGEAKDNQKQFFLKEIQSTTQIAVDDMISRLSDSMKSERYDYDTIFYAGNDTLPRWAGYKLGYYFVKKYLKRTNSTIFEATIASYSKFNPEI